MAEANIRRLVLSVPADSVDDAEYQELLALLRASSRSRREGRVGPHTASVFASWPEDADHAELTAIAERLTARFGGTLDTGPNSERPTLRSREAPSRRVGGPSSAT